MQRDREPANYEDPEALYERRPSAWVEPVGAWGAGRVELVQIPTPDETNDNIVAYWVPTQPPAPGKALDFAYRLHWQRRRPLPAGRAWVVQTRRGRGFVRQADGDINFVVDFDGPALRDLRASPSSKRQSSVGRQCRAARDETCSATGSPGLAHDRACQAAGCRPSRSNCGPSSTIDGRAITRNLDYMLPPEPDKP